MSTEKLTKALTDVIAERARQVSAEGWTPAHDDEHDGCQLAKAAGCYAFSGAQIIYERRPVSPNWPWNQEWWKPKDARRDLVRAGALILAEIERLDRAALEQQT